MPESAELDMSTQIAKFLNAERQAGEKILSKIKLIDTIKKQGIKEKIAEQMATIILTILDIITYIKEKIPDGKIPLLSHTTLAKKIKAERPDLNNTLIAKAIKILSGERDGTESKIIAFPSLKKN